MVKNIKTKLKLESNSGSGHFYTFLIFKKNLQNILNKNFSLSKFDPIIRKHFKYTCKKLD